MFRIHHRRRREKKTDFKKRLALIRSGKTRVVIRKRLNNISVQFVDFTESGDRTVASAFSQELEKYGWKFSTGNVPSSYLTGLLAGIKAKKKIREAILDLGLQTSTKGSRIYAALKGVVDSGINVPHSKEILPTENRIKGEHISKDVSTNFNEVKEKILKGS